MTQRQRFIRRWLFGYIAVLFGSLPFTVALWNSVLDQAIGRVLTIQHIHVAQYFGLGWLGALYASAAFKQRQALGKIFVVILAIGVCDELVQWVLPQRFFNWSDIWLNWAGGLLGLFVFGVLVCIRQHAFPGASDRKDGITAGTKDATKSWRDT